MPRLAPAAPPKQNFMYLNVRFFPHSSVQVTIEKPAPPKKCASPPKKIGLPSGAGRHVGRPVRPAPMAAAGALECVEIELPSTVLSPGYMSCRSRNAPAPSRSATPRPRSRESPDHPKRNQAPLNRSEETGECDRHRSNSTKDRCTRQRTRKSKHQKAPPRANALLRIGRPDIKATRRQSERERPKAYEDHCSDNPVLGARAHGPFSTS